MGVEKNPTFLFNNAYYKVKKALNTEHKKRKK